MVDGRGGSDTGVSRCRLMITGGSPLVLSVPLGKLDELEEALSASLDDDAACCCDVDLVIAAGADGKSDCSNREEETRVVEDKCLKNQKWPNCEP